jgi:hypothetical protein
MATSDKIENEETNHGLPVTGREMKLKFGNSLVSDWIVSSSGWYQIHISRQDA